MMASVFPGAFEKSWRVSFGRRRHRRSGDVCGVDVRRCRRRGLQRIGRHSYEVLGALELVVFAVQLGFEAQDIARRGSRAAANLGAKRAAKKTANGRAGKGSAALAAPFKNPPTELMTPGGCPPRPRSCRPHP